MDGARPVETRVLLSAIGRAVPVPPAEFAPIHARPAIHHGGPSSDGPAGPTTRRWAWLADTYWYVPTANLPAVLFNGSTGAGTSVSDQTVFHIAGYSRGYFSGSVVTQLGTSAPSSSNMIGSVTPEGAVLLSFTRTGSGSSPAVTQGIGRMTKRFGQWTMENQMFTSPTETLQIGHWAYMVQTRPGMPSWRSLPGVGESVPEFLGR
jgi:hypothetical protein